MLCQNGLLAFGLPFVLHVHVICIKLHLVIVIRHYGLPVVYKVIY